jgi:aldose 1-epimerase
MKQYFSPKTNITMRKLSQLALLLSVIFSCKNAESQNLTQRPFGKLKNGSEVNLYTLRNANGMEVSITNLGGHITAIKVPDRNGNYTDVTHSVDSLSQYEAGSPFFGPIVGRYGNRIGNASFVLDGQKYQLFNNNGPNTLHGGKVGFDKKIWATTMQQGSEPALVMKYTSPDMEEGFPGELTVTVTYKLLNTNAISINYQATTTKPTVVNLTNHAYFNLAGADGRNTIENHELTMAANRICPVDKGLIPTGLLQKVAGTAFDFTKGRRIGQSINDSTDVQIKHGGGYDHCFVFADSSKNLKLAATVYEPTSGRVLELLTTEPAVQFYTGNFLNGRVVGKAGVRYNRRSGFCLETQHYPDAPNKPNFPSTVLRPGQVYNTTTMYKFSVKK